MKPPSHHRSNDFFRLAPSVPPDLAAAFLALFARRAAIGSSRDADNQFGAEMNHYPSGPAVKVGGNNPWGVSLQRRATPIRLFNVVMWFQSSRPIMLSQ